MIQYYADNFNNQSLNFYIPATSIQDAQEKLNSIVSDASEYSIIEIKTNGNELPQAPAPEQDYSNEYL